MLSIAFQPESEPTALFAHRPTGICANNVVCSIPPRELLENLVNDAERVRMPSVLVETTRIYVNNSTDQLWLNFVGAKPGDLRSTATLVGYGAVGSVDRA